MQGSTTKGKKIWYSIFQAIEERRKRRRHLLNAQKVEGNDGLRRTKSNEAEDEEEEDSNMIDETDKASSKGESQWKSLKSRGATGAGQVSTFAPSIE